MESEGRERGEVGDFVRTPDTELLTDVLRDLT